jgi:hypothetical protein
MQTAATMANQAVAMTHDNHAHAEPITMRKRIGSVVYEVIIHFNQDAKEVMHDKILRLMRRDMEAEAS